MWSRLTGARRIPDMLHRGFFRGLSLLGAPAQRAALGRYFDWWHRTPDPWHLSTDDYERHKYLTTLRQVPEGTYRRVLDMGCSEGTFTRMLAEAYPQAEIDGVDISERALGRARDRLGDFAGRVRFSHADIMSFTRDHRFDLVFCAETLYYLGREDRLRRASERLGGLVAPGGLLVAVHPWPESKRLHSHLDASRAVAKVAEHVDDETHRPFAVSVYQAGTGRPD